MNATWFPVHEYSIVLFTVNWNEILIFDTECEHDLPFHHDGFAVWVPSNERLNGCVFTAKSHVIIIRHSTWMCDIFFQIPQEKILEKFVKI